MGVSEMLGFKIRTNMDIYVLNLNNPELSVALTTAEWNNPDPVLSKVHPRRVEQVLIDSICYHFSKNRQVRF